MDLLNITWNKWLIMLIFLWMVIRQGSTKTTFSTKPDPLGGGYLLNCRVSAENGVTRIEIKRGSSTTSIAFVDVNKPNEVQLVDATNTRFQGIGHIAPGKKGSFLTLTLPDASTKDNGKFSCLVRSGQSTISRIEAVLVVTQKAQATELSYDTLVQKVLDLETKLTKQQDDFETKLKQQERTFTSQMNKLTSADIIQDGRMKHQTDSMERLITFVSSQIKNMNLTLNIIKSNDVKQDQYIEIETKNNTNERSTFEAKIKDMEQQFEVKLKALENDTKVEIANKGAYLLRRLHSFVGKKIKQETNNTVTVAMLNVQYNKLDDNIHMALREIEDKFNASHQQLNADQTDMRLQILVTQHEQNQTKAEMASLNQKLNTVDGKHAAFDRLLNDSTSADHLKSLKDQLATLENRLNNSNSQQLIDSQVATLNVQMKQVRSKFADYDQKINSFSQSVDMSDVTSAIFTMQSDYMELKAKTDTLADKDSVDDLKNRLQQLDKQVQKHTKESDYQMIDIGAKLVKLKAENMNMSLATNQTNDQDQTALLADFGEQIATLQNNSLDQLGQLRQQHDAVKNLEARLDTFKNESSEGFTHSSDNISVLLELVNRLDTENTNQSKHIDSLINQGSLSDIVERVALLEEGAKNISQGLSNFALKDELTSTMNEVVNLEQQTLTQITYLNTTIKGPLALINQKLVEMEIENDNQTQEINDLQNKGTIDRIEYELEQVSNKTSKLLAWMKKDSTPVAFSAALNGKQKLTSGQTLIFGDVKLQDGSGYDKNTGIFTAPQSGLYSFHLVISTRLQGGKWIDVALKKKQGKLEEEFGILSSRIPGEEHQTSISSIAHLRTGDKVWAVGKYASGIELDKTSLLNTFSGFLVVPF